MYVLLFALSLDGRWSEQASSEDLFPLGYGERERLGEGETGDNPPPSNSLPPGEGEMILITLTQSTLYRHAHSDYTMASPEKLGHS